MKKTQLLKFSATVGGLTMLFNSALAQVTVTTANQCGALPLTPSWVPAANSLIAEMAPSSAIGDFSMEAADRNVNSLTAGGSLTISLIPGNSTGANYVVCGDNGGAGAVVIYTLPASPNGYDLTNITVYGGWKDNGRDGQAYTVSYSTVANPSVFTVLTAVNYNPSVPGNTASVTRVILADATGGLIASNVVEVKFDFSTSPSENGYTGYGAITVEGTASKSPTKSYKLAVASQPRIVNIYNFIRDNDFRLADSQQVLFNATTQQFRLVKQANLPATWAFQYDALIDTNYQNFFKQNLRTNDEIGAWWEIPQTLVERAGLTWRGHHEWDPSPNVGFSCGYTPAERRKLVDAYMADFKAIFGHYPQTVGSWYVDEVTLAYMAQQYGIVASCNCKDQIGTDTYTLWGSYWNQAYYPSSLNAYMPAQTRAGQINVPVFRMLGSDPIYQYGNFWPGIISLEPVYPAAGGSANWVASFMNNLITQPSLAFGYTQSGQENSFGWPSMATGLTRQVALIAAQARAGEIRVETLAQSGQWFRKNYSVTPATAVVALDDGLGHDRKSIWYDSRFYRLNLLWDKGTFNIRDLHCFNESMVSPTHSTALTTPFFNYETLPIMDGGLWSGTESYSVGMWPVLLNSGGTASAMVPQGRPVVKELNSTDLSIQQSLSSGGTFSVICAETNITCVAVDAQGRPVQWAWDMAGGAKQASAVQSVSTNVVTYTYGGVQYQLKLSSGFCQQLSNGIIRLSPDSSGKMVMILN